MLWTVIFRRRRNSSMKIGTIIFTYHRSRHTREVIDALSKNDTRPQKLYIFQDGRKESTNCAEWERVNEIISNINWCEAEVHVSDKNMGLAKSIVAGINYVMQECDAVIVLEDDCVPHKQFMKFMTSALNFYQEAKKVYSVSGYAWNVALPDSEEDAYFNGRCCSYGWGTWRDRWSQYEEDYLILNKIRDDFDANTRLNIWGQDLENMIQGNISGKCSSWAAFWGLKIIEKGGYCLSPYKQLIYNIGFDGSGTHSGKQQEGNTLWQEEYQDTFSFPLKIESTDECKREFRFLLGGIHGVDKFKLYQDVLVQWIQAKQEGKGIHIPNECNNSIAVWGKGKIFDCLFHEIESLVSVEYIVESRPRVQEYKGIPVISIDTLPKCITDIVVIPYFDIAIIRGKVQNLRPDIRLWGLNELFQ